MRKPEHQVGKTNDPQKQNGHRYEKWKCAPENGGNGDIWLNSFDHVNIHAHRRGDDSNLADQYDDNTEPNRIVVQLQDHWIDDGDGEHNQGHGVDKAATDKIKQADEHHDTDGR